MSGFEAWSSGLDAVLPKHTAGSLPSSRTHLNVLDVLESGDVDRLRTEVLHANAHYQSLEFMLNNEDELLRIVLQSFDPGEVSRPAPKPESVEDAVRLTLRVVGSVALSSAYSIAHSAMGVRAISGMDVQRALQMLYSGLDFSDPDNELTDADLEELLRGEDGDGGA